MSPRARILCSRLTRSFTTLALAALAVTGCYSAVRTQADPSVSTQAIGSSRSWTSNSVVVRGTVFAVLDLSANSTGDCSDSRLYTADMLEAGEIAR